MNERGEIELFFGGIIIGMALVGAEVTSFAYSTVLGALTQASPSVAASAGTAAMALPWFALFILVIEVVHNFLIGLLLPEEFSAGFLLGDLAVLVIVGSALWAAMPSAVLGLIAALVVVLVGLIIKAEGDRHPKTGLHRSGTKAKLRG